MRGRKDGEMEGYAAAWSGQERGAGALEEGRVDMREGMRQPGKLKSKQFMKIIGMRRGNCDVGKRECYCQKINRLVRMVMTCYKEEGEGIRKRREGRKDSRRSIKEEKQRKS